MSKSKDTSKEHWIEVDRRIRDRLKYWRGEEVRELDEQLADLPDLAEQVEFIDIPQPAVAAEPDEQDAGDDSSAAPEASAEQAPAADEVSN